MQVTHRKTEDKYQELRDKSRQIAQNALPPGLIDVVNLKPVDSLSLSHSKRWEISESRKEDANWSWEDSIPDYSYRHPKRFDLAIWYANAQLCGLCIGKPTFTGSRLRLDVIEGAPINHPLKGKVVSISISAAEAYADLIGADQIRIMRPLNKDLIRYYQNHGFTYRQGKASNTPSYLWRNL